MAVDILMPCRDASATLGDCLESIAAQEGVAWRLVAVDDGSTDGTRGLLEAFARRYPSTLVLSTGGRGLVEALNLGLRHATASLIARMDADDTMRPSRLAVQAGFLARHPECGVVGCRVEENGLSGGFREYLRWSNELVTPEAIATARFIESPIVHPTACFRRGIVERQGAYREGPFPEDYDLWLRWLEAGVVFAKVPEVLLRWTDPPRRLTRTDPRYGVQAFYDLKAQYLARWLERHSPFGKHVWIWGAGRVTRQRVRHLRRHGVEFERFVDIDPRKIGTVNRDGEVVGPDALPGPERSFVLAAVGSRGARAEMRERLETRGYREGRSFLCMA